MMIMMLLVLPDGDSEDCEADDSNADADDNEYLACITGVGDVAVVLLLHLARRPAASFQGQAWVVFVLLVC